MASIYEIHFPLTSAVGGGPLPPEPIDRFAPKILVGNQLQGDTATEILGTNGFWYYSDAGDGVRLAAALAQAGLGKPWDVWIRPGIYIVSSTLIVPSSVTVRGSGDGPGTQIVADASLAGPVFALDEGSTLRDVVVTQSEPPDPGKEFGIVTLTGATAFCQDVIARGNTPTPTSARPWFRAAFFAPSDSTLFATRCTALFGSNGASTPTAKFCGFLARPSYGGLYLTDCIAMPEGKGDTGPAVLVQQANLTISGGAFTNVKGTAVWCESTANVDTRRVQGLITGATIRSGYGAEGDTDPAGVRVEGFFDVGVHNCNIEAFGDPQSPSPSACVRYVPTPLVEYRNAGRLVGCNLNGDSATQPWCSQDGLAGVSGYHTIVSNTYRGGAPAVIIGSPFTVSNFVGPITATVTGLPFALSGFAGGEQIDVAVDGGLPVTVTFAAGDQTPAQVATAINLAVGLAIAADGGGFLVITSPTSGAGSSINLSEPVVGVLAAIGLTAGITVGTDAESLSLNVDGAGAVIVYFTAADQTPAQVAAAINAALGSTVAADGGGFLVLSGTVTGIAGSLLLSDGVVPSLAAIGLFPTAAIGIDGMLAPTSGLNDEVAHNISVP